MFVTRAATLCLSAGRYSFPYRISSTCPGKSRRSARVNCETIGRGEKLVDFERDIDCQGSGVIWESSVMVATDKLFVGKISGNLRSVPCPAPV